MLPIAVMLLTDVKSLRTACAYAAQSFFLSLLCLTCGLKAVKNMVAMVSICPPATCVFLKLFKCHLRDYFALSECLHVFVGPSITVLVCRIVLFSIST